MNASDRIDPCSEAATGPEVTLTAKCLQSFTCNASAHLFFFIAHFIIITPHHTTFYLMFSFNSFVPILHVSWIFLH